MEGADDRNRRGAGKGRAATDGTREACDSGRAQPCSWQDGKADPNQYAVTARRGTHNSR